MAKSITTYKELLDEKEKLHELLQARKQLIHADVEVIKSQLKPLSEIRAHVKSFTVRNAIRLALALNSDVITKKIFEKIIVSRGGWLTKVLVPYFLKKYTSSFVGEEKDKVISWARSLVRKIKRKAKKEKSHAAPDDDENNGHADANTNS